jgi:mannose-6-phosphate isomerase
MQSQIYPLKFVPILKDRIWGGRKLKTLLGKDIQSDITGESWELSGVEGDISVVADGPLKGKSLNDLILLSPSGILGTAVSKRFGTTFPLLFKYLDAREDLSIQVHPNDELAKKRHNSFGKTEMWYVVQADRDSEIIVGFKEDSSAEEYVSHLSNNTLLELLDSRPVQKGDVFFLETGTVHAIRAGLLIAEIQQTSDITYRIYDYDRVDAEGNKRQLHVDEALEAINYKASDTQKRYAQQPNAANNMVQCPYFTTSYVPLDGTYAVKHDAASFRVYMCTEGKFELSNESDTWQFAKGDTVLVPAALSDFQLTGYASLLEIYIS